MWLVASACSSGGPVVVGNLPADTATPGDGGGASVLESDGDGGLSMAADAADPAATPPGRDAGPASADAGAGGPPSSRDRLELERSTRAEFCDGRGPPVRVVSADSASGSHCRAQLARRLSSYALCTCDSVSFSGETFTVDAFDARVGAYTQGSGGAAVGINRDLLGTATDTHIFGSLLQHGTRLVAHAGTRLRIDDDLSTMAVLDSASASIEVGRDARLAVSQSPASAASLHIGRDLLQPSDSTPASGAMVVGSTRRETYELTRPCACGADSPLDVRQIVAQAQQSPDNDAVGLARTALAGTLSTLPVVLACGRFVLDEVSPFGNVGLTVPGRTALFVAGNFSITGNLLLDLGSSGELDVFVGGDLTISTLGLAQLGSAARPWALRFYVSGSAPIRILGLGVLAAQIYAPNAAVEIGANTALYGSVFAASFSGRDASIHYDRSIVELGENCPPGSSSP